MYEIWVWREDVNEYVPERPAAKFEHWTEANEEATKRYVEDGTMRKVQYNSPRRRRGR